MNKIDADDKNVISESIKRKLVEQFGTIGYASIIKTAVNESGYSEKEITSNFKLFETVMIHTFDDIGKRKIVEPVLEEIQQNNTMLNDDLNKKKINEMKILIADDEPQLLQLYRDWLKLDNTIVYTVKDGKECKDLYQREHDFNKTKNKEKSPFDVVILDYMMPKMDGLDTAQWILKLNPKQRIIIASGHLEKTLVDALNRLGRSIEIIKKPFSIEELENMIKNTKKIEALTQLNLNIDKMNHLEKYQKTIKILKYN